MKSQIDELIEMYVAILDTFEKNYSEEICASMARVCMCMFRNLLNVGFNSEQAMSLMCAMSGRFKTKDNN